MNNPNVLSQSCGMPSRCTQAVQQVLGTSRGMGQQPLHFAASLGRSESHEAARFSAEVAVALVELLCSNGADPGAVDSMGYNPMHLAAYHGNVAVLSKVLKPSGVVA